MPALWAYNAIKTALGKEIEEQADAEFIWLGVHFLYGGSVLMRPAACGFLMSSTRPLILVEVRRIVVPVGGPHLQSSHEAAEHINVSTDSNVKYKSSPNTAGLGGIKPETVLCCRPTTKFVLLTGPVWVCKTWETGARTRA